MKVVVLGGYGVFGSRLVELLVRDGHDVVIAGRSFDKATTLAERLGCGCLAVDIRTDAEVIFSASPEIVVDAAGPFQTYGHDPYPVPRLCLDHGADYLDLSDNAGFTIGINVLDDRARRIGRRLLSGVSSVPGISSAVAVDLCAGLDEILLIDTAILPGNRAPRGTSLISSIVGQLGTTSQVWRGGMWREQPCWSDSRLVRLAPDLARTARFIEVPDIQLFPGFFGARSVVFRAGMELNLLNTAMRLVGWARQRWSFGVTNRRVEFFRRVSNLLLPFGTDRGGMRVLVVGRKDNAVVKREWRLVAESGDGPYIPAVAARALIRRLDRVPPGARPCMGEATRAEIEGAMTDLAVSADVRESLHPSLFQNALAERWNCLPREIQALHGVQDVENFSGTAQVTRGSSLVAKVAAWFFGFPPAAEAVSLTVTMTRTESGETWERNFGGRVLRSFLTPAPLVHRFRERFWLFDFELDLPVEDGCMRFPVRRGWFLGVPLPNALLPRSDTREYVEGGVFHFDVALGAPFGAAQIVRYRGHLKPKNEREKTARLGHG